MSQQTSITTARELARLLEPTWPRALADLRSSGVPLNAGDPEGPSSDPTPAPGAPETTPPANQPPPAAATPPAGQPEGEPTAVPESLAPFMDRITPLLEPDENGHTMLAGLLEFYELTGDPERADEFEQWWEQVGQSYGFLDPEGEPAGGEPEGEPAEEDMPEWAQRLQQENAELRARLDGTDEQSRISAQEQAVQEQLTTLMTQHGIQEDRSLPEEKWPSTRILRLALSFDGDVEKAVAEFLDMTGQAQQQLVNGAGEETLDVSRLAHAGAPGPSLRGGSPDMEPEPVQGWQGASQAALARMRSSGG